MKRLWDYTLEEYLEKILPNYHPRFRESVLKSETRKNYSYVKFKFERIDMEIDNLRAKRKELNKQLKKLGKEFEKEVSQGVTIK